jgi:hypothetical protein
MCRPELRAHMRVRPYSAALFDCDSVSNQFWETAANLWRSIPGETPEPRKIGRPLPQPLNLSTIPAAA